MSYLSENYRLTALDRKGPILKGADAFVSKLYGRWKSRQSYVKPLLVEAEEITSLSVNYQNWSDEKLKQALSEISRFFRYKGKDSTKNLFEAFALIRESVFRTLGFRPYSVQMAGALAMYRGYIAEMSTGEGKTVTAAMVGVLHGWSIFPVHVITSNDYLASRDAEIMEPLYTFCGVSVGSVVGDSKPDERKLGYAKDITYTTAGELLADFLRDRIALGKNQSFEKRILNSLGEESSMALQGIVMRGIHTAIVDEADNVLIDEAVTPLIISKEEPNEAFEQACSVSSQLAKQLKKGVDYETNTQFKSVHFIKPVDHIISQHSVSKKRLFSSVSFQKELLRQAIVAKEFFHNNKQYVIEIDDKTMNSEGEAQKKVVIVDEATGRRMPMRSWSSGLHQMVEAKEGVPITPLKETQARLSFQRFFRFYKHFSGMTGTAREAVPEFWHVYGISVISIPNHKPCKRKVIPLRVFVSESQKWSAIIQEIEAVHKKKRPVLIGTRSVEKSEYLASKLIDMGLPCRVVNAVRQHEEAAIIKVAGEEGAITVATNMAGRGTDIKLKGTVNSLGGLHVIATECHGSSRVDRQLFGRSARQGDFGSASSFSSLDDELLKNNLPELFKIFYRITFSFAPPLRRLLGLFLVKMAQFVAQKRDYQSRLSVQRMDTWLDDSLSFAGDDVE